MLINQKAVKTLAKDHKKRLSKEFLETLDYSVREGILKAVKNSRHFKTLKASDLLLIKF